MTKLDLSRLLRFYLGCVESEDRRSLTKQLSAIHRSLVSPWSAAEPLFHAAAVESPLEVELESDRRVLLGGAPAGAAAERFFYGYPIFLDRRGFLSPLFVAEVGLEHRGAGRFVMRIAPPGEIRLNDHVFRRRRTPPEELQAIQRDLARDQGSFPATLRAAFAALGGAPMPALGRSPLEPYPASGSAGERWVNRPILFKSETSVYTHQLRKELAALAGTPRLLDAVARTAAGVLLGLTARQAQAAGREAPPAALLPVLPLNQSQEAAARAALQEVFSVVTGPPGTGKSQLVVDLLASCALAGNPVLFASKNNKAIDVVRARLRAILGEDHDWTLRLGSREAMEAARQEMAARLGRLRPEAAATEEAPSPEPLRDLAQKVAGMRRRIAELERARARYVDLDRARRIAEGLVEPRWVEIYAAGRTAAPPSPRRVERLHARCGAVAGRRPIGPWLRLRRALAPAALAASLRRELGSLAAPLPPRLRRDLESLADRPSESRFGALADACGQLACLTRWRTADDARARAFAELCAHETAAVLGSRLDELTRRWAELSCGQLRSGWTGRLAARGAAVRRDLDRYFDLASPTRESRRGGTLAARLAQLEAAVLALGGDLPVWVVSSLSVRNAIPLEPALFDLVIVDEASQCDVASALPLLFRARRALIIGDSRQLRHISALSSAEEETLAAETGVEHLVPWWSYRRRSLFAAAEESAVRRGAEPALLAEHYRCHPAIIEFPNRAMYQGRLIVRTPVSTLRDKLAGQPLGLFWHDRPGAVPPSSGSAHNEAEVTAILELLDRWWRHGWLARETVDFGVVTPFRLQMERLEDAVRGRPWWERVKERLTIGTAHRFQGDERDVMIFSPVVARGMPPRLVRWVAATDQLLNVAITRARGALHVVGDRRACLAAGGCLGAFAAAAGDGDGGRDGNGDREGDGGIHRGVQRAPESPAAARLADLLAEAGLWVVPQAPLGGHRLDFLAVTPSGTRYDVELDGRERLDDAARLGDEARDAAVAAAGIKVLRIEACQILHHEEAIRKLLRRLV